LAAIVESSDDVIVSKNLSGVITSWNHAAERMFGWTAAEAVGRHITLIIPDDRRAEEDEVLARIRRGERVDHFETVRKTKDGELVDVSITVSPVRDARGRIVGASKIARDITERRRIEEQRTQLLARERVAREAAEAANRGKDEFLAMLSHELRTPLNGVFGWARMLQSGALDEATRARAVTAIVRGAAAQMKLIDDLLDVSRIVTGNLRLDLQRVDLRGVLEAALETVRPAASAKDITIEAELPPTPVTIRGAADRLQQVLWNLLINAVKFTPRKGRLRALYDGRGGSQRQRLGRGHRERRAALRLRPVPARGQLDDARPCRARARVGARAARGRATRWVRDGAESRKGAGRDVRGAVASGAGGERLRRLDAGYSRYQAAERVGIDRLLDVFGEPGGAHARARVLASIRGGGDDGDVAEHVGGQVLELAHEPVAILADHRDVADDRVRPQPGGEGDPVARVVGRGHLGPTRGQNHREQLEDVRIVVDDQHAKTDQDSLKLRGVLPR
jgi:PAS domain S-box-containing protein